MTIRDTDKMLGPAVREAVDALTVQERDAAAVRLALMYGELIDTHRDPAWALRWIGPLLLDCLETLGCTPAARAKLKEGTPLNAGPNRLQVIRGSRR